MPSRKPRLRADPRLLREQAAVRSAIESPPGTTDDDFAPPGRRRSRGARPRFRLTVQNGQTKVVRPESVEQIAVMQWHENAMRQWPELRLLFAVPNGGKRDAAEAAHLKRQGVKAGVPDLLLPVCRGGYSGLGIELKVGDNKPTDLQLAWHAELRDQGWRVEVCYGATAAIDVLREYLQA